MFVLSLKINRLKVAGIVCFCVLVVTLVMLNAGHNKAQTVLNTNIKGSTNEERLTFISSKGWQVKNSPSETVDIIIPSEFDNIYDKYNSIQKKQGFDLTKYKGKKVSRHTYEVTNYEGEENPVNINLLVYDGTIIGGDVCSTALGGFIHGFEKPSE